MTPMRSKLALILLGMILGALGSSLFSGQGGDSPNNPPPAQSSINPLSASGPLRLESDVLAEVTSVLPADPAKATVADGVSFSGAEVRPSKRDTTVRIRVTAYASSAEPNEAVLAVFYLGRESPVALVGRPLSDNRREKIELEVDIPRVGGGVFHLDVRIGPGRPGTIVLNGPRHATEPAVSVITISE
jgi:hypothetical protein